MTPTKGAATRVSGVVWGVGKGGRRTWDEGASSSNWSMWWRESFICISWKNVFESSLASSVSCKLSYFSRWQSRFSVTVSLLTVRSEVAVRLAVISLCLIASRHANPSKYSSPGAAVDTSPSPRKPRQLFEALCVNT